nr:MAG: hypothetical protein [Microvirus sp.]
MKFHKKSGSRSHFRKYSGHHPMNQSRPGSLSRGGIRF